MPDAKLELEYRISFLKMQFNTITRPYYISSKFICGAFYAYSFYTGVVSNIRPSRTKLPESILIKTIFVGLSLAQTCLARSHLSESRDVCSLMICWENACNHTC